MKIVHLFYNFEIGGAENMTLALIANDQKYNHLIIVFKPRVDFQAFCENQLDIKFINLNWQRRGILRASNWISLIKALKKSAPDLIHTHMYDASFFGRLAGFVLGIPSVSTFVNQYHRKKYSRGIANFLLAKITKVVIACSEDVKNDILRFDRIKKEKIIVVPSFTNTDFKKDNSLNIRSTLFIKDTDSIFLFIARLVPQKRIDLLILAFNIIINTRKIKNLKLLIVGDGSLRAELTHLISLKSLHTFVYLLGEQRNLNPYLTESDYYVDTSERAGLSLAAIKALEAGLTLIMSDVGGIAELNQKEKFVRTFEPNNVFSLVDAISNCATIRPVKNKNAMKYAKANFSGKVGARKITNIYDSILLN